jgi:uncharacterized protein (TIGR03435 family)
MLLLACAALFGEETRFEVASIKPSANPNPGDYGTTTKPGRLLMENLTLKRAVMGAYRLGPNQVAGGPDWFDSERWVIEAKAEGPAGDSELMKMLQGLLAERFALQVHRESRPMNAFVLEVAKGGPKMQRSTADEGKTLHGRGSIDAIRMSMARLAEVLSRQTELPVVNRTGIDGEYDFRLEWTLDRDRPEKDGPSLFTAIQEQLGLRLRAEKTPIEVLVVDGASRPSAN